QTHEIFSSQTSRNKAAHQRGSSPFCHSGQNVVQCISKDQGDAGWSSPFGLQSILNRLLDGLTSSGYA
ncbi:hypothetical protein, partial [Aerobium aerolatum]